MSKITNDWHDNLDLSILPKNVPKKLQSLQRWVIWEAVKKDKDKIAKVPKQIKNPKIGASINNPQHLGSFDAAVETCFLDPKIAGIGFVLPSAQDYNNDIFGIDIDHCIDKNVIAEWAQQIVDDLKTYWEISPSGTGLRAFGLGNLPGRSFNNHKKGVEFYASDSHRFLTVTGKKLKTSQDDVCHVDADKLMQNYKAYSNAAAPTALIDSDFVPGFLTDLPDLKNLNLKVDHLKFFQKNIVADKYASRSEALFAAIMSLYRADLSDAQILSLLVKIPATYNMALEHRGKNRTKAIKYLWQQCQAAKIKLDNKVTSVDFDDLSDSDSKIKKKLLERYAYIISLDKYYDLKSGLLLVKPALTTAYKHVIDSAHKFLMHNAKTRKMDSLIYYPGCAKKEITWQNKYCLNIWQSPKLKLPEIVDDNAITIWLDHASYLIPNFFERHHFFDWLAFTLQHQDQKINHGILFAGPQRIGKDTLIQPLITGLGSHNVSQPNAAELKEPYTDYLHQCKLIIFQEIENFEKREIENKLKSMLAAPPEVLSIRLFGKGFYDTPNLVSAIFMSNHRNALKISKSDGRYFALWCDVEKKENDYYQKLWQWLEDKGTAAVIKWLLQRDLSNFNCKAPAPRSDYKKQLIELGRSDTEMRLIDLIADAAPPLDFAVVQFADFKKALNEISDNRDRPISNKELSSVLAEFGVIKRQVKSNETERKEYTLWIIPAHPKYFFGLEKMTGQELLSVSSMHTNI